MSLSPVFTGIYIYIGWGRGGGGNRKNKQGRIMLLVTLHLLLLPSPLSLYAVLNKFSSAVLELCRTNLRTWL